MGSRSGRLYVSGPMSGIPQFNFPAFHAASDRLRGMGYDVISPADLDGEDTAWIMRSEDGILPPGKRWTDYLARDVALVAGPEVEAVVVLDGWSGSSGANLEVAVARALRKPILRLDDEGLSEVRFDALDCLSLNTDGAALDFEESFRAAVAPNYSHGEREVVDPKTGGRKGFKKFDHGKARYDLIPPFPLEALARLYAVGARKYGAENWRKGTDYSRYFSAAMRHLYAWRRGERFDVENREEHLTAVLFCVITLMEFERTGTGNDDRPEVDEAPPAYFAGLIDADGYILMKKAGFGVTVGVTQTKADALHRLVSVYGGRLRDHDSHVKRNPRARPAFVWRCPADECNRFLTDILPFLAIKRRQAEIALEAITLKDPTAGAGGRRKRDPHFTERLQELCKEMADLNSRGVPA